MRNLKRALKERHGLQRSDQPAYEEARAVRFGRVKRTVVPAPGVLSAQMAPP